MYKPGTVVRVKSNQRGYAIPPLTAGVVQAVENDRGEYSHFVRWDRRLGDRPHQETYIPEAAIEPLPDDP